MKITSCCQITFNIRRSILFLAFLLILCVPIQTMAANSAVQNFYIQIGLGVGLGLESYATQEADTAASKDIALHFTGRAHLGISNIMEVEWQHQISSKTSAVDNYGFDMLLYKLNPFPENYNTDSEPFYFVLGSGDIHYTNKSAIVWQGDSKVIGMEWAIMSYRRTYRVGIKRITATDSSATATAEKTSMVIIDFSVAIGY